jgi:hypothetical protein
MPVVSIRSSVWIVPEQRRHHGRAQRRPKRLVEIVLQRERALPRGGLARIKRRLGVMLLERGDDARGIRDGAAVEPQNGKLALARRAPDTDQVIGAEHAAPVRDALVVERPARLFAIVRERDVPQHRGVHGGLACMSKPNLKVEARPVRKTLGGNSNQLPLLTSAIPPKADICR